jgi:predicted nucleic acid-binding protein
VTYLVDTSAAARILHYPAIREAWEKHLAAGVVAICDPVELELLYSARSLADRLNVQETLRGLFAWTVTPERAWTRAHVVQQLLTEQGAHRSAGVVDLLVAATAEQDRLVLLHYDRDFETIARATGQPTAWVAEPGGIA